LTAHPSGYLSGPPGTPREMNKAILPPYTVEPPDILTIEAVHAVPKFPYRVKTLDTLSIEVNGTLPDAPISGIYPVGPGGRVELGIAYGALRVAGQTVDEIKVALEKHLREYLKEPLVHVSLAQLSTMQQIAGQHLVAPDGTVTLGSYGRVEVVGKTLPEAKATIEAYLADYLDDPEVIVDVYAYNSKVYYVVTQGAGLGDGVYRFPITGNETVLDAVSQINGLESVSSKRMWIARPASADGHVTVMPVHWDAITAEASISSNYQVLPGDRIFIAEDKLIALDNAVAKILSPIERMMGFAILGAGTATRFSGKVLRGGGNPNGNF
jgi:polysaccharide export outer membrane protein